MLLPIIIRQFVQGDMKKFVMTSVFVLRMPLILLAHQQNDFC